VGRYYCWGGLYLKNVVRVGGEYGPYALRALGKDTSWLHKMLKVISPARYYLCGVQKLKAALMPFKQQFLNELQQQRRPFVGPRRSASLIANMWGINYVCAERRAASCEQGTNLRESKLGAKKLNQEKR